MNKIKQFSEDEASSDASENTQISGFKAPKTVTEFGLTYKSYQFLQRLASGAHHIRPEPLEAIFHELCQISKDLKLSELEIA